jgi:opacity protein-like surface antigen
MSRAGVVRVASLPAFALALLCLAPAEAAAQAAAAPAQTDSATGNLYFRAGFLSTTFLGDCTDCEGAQYRSTGSLLAAGGWTLNPRTDLGIEILRVFSQETESDRIRVTVLLGSVQFRPWRTRGFFLKAGAGMAFVHNWILQLEGEDPSFRSKAFALDLGVGWEWRLSRHVGVQVLGGQHVAALGDLETSERTVENVMANFWSAGAAIVIR